MSRFGVALNVCDTDIIWALPTVRELFRGCAERVDVAIPASSQLSTLLRKQHYIDSVLELHNPAAWLESVEYTQRWNLAKPDYTSATPIMKQFGIPLKLDFVDVLPFVDTDTSEGTNAALGLVAFAFNPDKANQAANQGLIQHLRSTFHYSALFEDLGGLAPHEIAESIAGSAVFIGDRQTIAFALAHGLNKPVITYETLESMREPVYSCPFGNEIMYDRPLQYSLYDAALEHLLSEAGKVLTE